MANKYYPIMMNIKNKRAVVVGGGKVALRKTKGLLKHEADITVISPRFIDSFKELEAQNNVRLIKRAYKVSDLDNSALLFICTDDSDVNERCYRDSRDRNILVNNCDNQDHSDFIVPSRIQKGDLTISISTGGNSPTLASELKRTIEEALPNHIDEYIEALGIIRDKTKNEIEDIKLRKIILNTLVQGDVLERFEKGIIDDIQSELLDIYNNCVDQWEVK